MVTGCSCGGWASLLGGWVEANEKRNVEAHLPPFLSPSLPPDLLINILLTCCGYFPGHLHSFWLIYKQMKVRAVSSAVLDARSSLFLFHPRPRSSTDRGDSSISAAENTRYVLRLSFSQRTASKADNRASSSVPARRRPPSSYYSPGQLRLYQPRLRKEIGSGADIQ